jgi:hypothetical protein
VNIDLKFKENDLNLSIKRNYIRNMCAISGLFKWNYNFFTLR